MTGGKLINTTDPKLNYFIADEIPCIKEWGAVYEPKIVNPDKLDYGITNKDDPNYKVSGDILDSMRKNIKTTKEIDEYCDNFENNMKQKKLSYIQVQNVEQGSEWYRKEFPKLPDDLCNIMARWNWGELDTLTKKKLKNDKKKIKTGKANKKTKQLYNLDIKQGNFVLDFN